MRAGQKNKCSPRQAKPARRTSPTATLHTHRSPRGKPGTTHACARACTLALPTAYVRSSTRTCVPGDLSYLGSYTLMSESRVHAGHQRSALSFAEHVLDLLAGCIGDDNRHAEATEKQSRGLEAKEKVCDKHGYEQAVVQPSNQRTKCPKASQLVENSCMP